MEQESLPLQMEKLRLSPSIHWRRPSRAKGNIASMSRAEILAFPQGPGQLKDPPQTLSYKEKRFRAFPGLALVGRSMVPRDGPDHSPWSTGPQRSLGSCLHPSPLITARPPQEWCLGLSVTSAGKPPVIFLSAMSSSRSPCNFMHFSQFVIIYLFGWQPG